MRQGLFIWILIVGTQLIRKYHIKYIINKIYHMYYTIGSEIWGKKLSEEEW